MRLKTIILLIITIVFMCDCSESKKKEEIVWDGKVKNLVGERIYLDPALSTTFRIRHVSDNYIISKSSSNLHHFSLSKLQNDSIIYGYDFLRQGRGPKEMLIPTFEKNSTNGEYFFYDVNNGQGKIIGTNTNDIIGIYDENKWKELDNIDAIKNVMGLFPLDADYSSFIALMMLGSPSDAMFYKIVKNSVIPLNFSFPKNELGEESIYARHIAYAGRLLKQPEEDRYVYFSNHNRYVHIFDFESDHIKTISEPYTRYPHYTSADGFNPRMPEEYYALLCDVFVTKEYIYALMSEATIKDIPSGTFNGWPLNYSNAVYIFDWKGNPINKLMLDVHIGYLFVDTEHQYIYGITEYVDEQSAAVYKFKL